MSIGSGWVHNTGLLVSPIDPPISLPCAVYAATANTYRSLVFNPDTYNSQSYAGTCYMTKYTG